MSSGAQRVWITRAEPGASATAERVAALGHMPVVAPLMRIEPVEAPQVDLRGVAALAFTSANGVRAFAAAEPSRNLKVFAVGAGTAAAVKAAGFRQVLSADGDVAALAQRIRNAPYSRVELLGFVDSRETSRLGAMGKNKLLGKLDELARSIRHCRDVLGLGRRG